MTGLMFPIWKGSIVLRESVLPLADIHGDVDDIQLMYPADSILEVLNATCTKRFTEGLDYTLKDGKLHILSKGSILTMTYREYYPDEPIENGSFAKVGGGNIRFDNESFFHKYQILVTYRHHAAWPDEYPADKTDLLPNTAKKLKSSLPLKIAYYGDSISVGYNSSSFSRSAPFQPDWCDMASLTLEQIYGSKIETIRAAENGMDSVWGVENVYDRVTKHSPDLFVLAFGMNDGHRTPAEFIDNIKRMIDNVRTDNECCETILVSTMLPNKEAKGFFVNQKEYEAHLLGLEQQGIAICDMTRIHEVLLSRKAYRDMTGNNINHPNDFLSRVYAQALLATLGADE